ncbi:hypothetical protein ACIQW9_02050 [Herminiimonas sp. NPDC097707]|uniref:hypothetical protein n=1 Tax=Herminiimonas sp. NPDC097707 TaxID=3364007 RepID=UPI00383A1289
MSKMSGEQASQLAIDLIEEQLQILPAAIAMIWQPIDACGVEANLVAGVLRRKNKLPKTGSGGNIAASYADVNPALDFRASHQALHADPLQKTRYLRVVIGNALLAVGAFFKEHDMAAMRTPEVQFLGHVYTAILNENTFDIAPGYLPVATFDGLVIDGKLNGSLLFSDGVTEGFMEFGDALALLHWFSRFLRGEKNFVSGGDAG